MHTLQLCPSFPVGAKTWPDRVALRSHMMSKHGWRNPWRQYVAGSCCPVCRTQFHSRARAVDHLAHRAERCRQATQEDPDRFPKREPAVHAKAGPTGSAGAQEGIKTWSLLAGGLLAGCTKRASKRTLNTVVCEGPKLSVAERVSPPPCTRKSAKVMFLLPCRSTV